MTICDHASVDVDILVPQFQDILFDSVKLQMSSHLKKNWVDYKKDSLMKGG